MKINVFKVYTLGNVVEKMWAKVQLINKKNKLAVCFLHINESQSQSSPV